METRGRSTPPPTNDGIDPRGLGELFRALAEDASALVRHEVALAKAEMRDAVRTIVSAAARIGAGAVLACTGALVLVAALVVFLGDVMGGRYALSAGIVGAVLVAAGGVLAFLGARGVREASLAPEEALESLRETGDWARGEVAEFRAALGNGMPGRELDGRTGISVAPARLPAVAGGGVRAAEDGGGARAGAGGTQGPASAPPRDTRLPVSEPIWKRVLHEFKEDRVTDQGARVAYYFFMSFPPAIMAIFALAGLFGGPALADWLMARAASAMPGEAAALVEGFVNDVVHGNAPGPLSIGLLLALWAGSNVFLALDQSLNIAYDVHEERSFVTGRAVALGMLLSCSLLFLLGSVVLIAGPGVPDWVGLGAAGALAWRIAEWPLAFLLIASTFWLIYYILPLRDQSGCKGTLFKAAAISALLWIVATAAFRFYITNFGSYGETYGILGTVIVLLLWLYVTSVVMILGGEIASEMERGGSEGS
jgi:membrane protein